MKRRLISLALSLLALSFSVLCVQALSQRVHDEAALMSSEDVSRLESLAEEISKATGLDLVILTVDDLGGRVPSAYADDYYDSNGYSDHGMLFMLAMEERDWYISTSGEAIRIFTDRDIDTLLDTGLPFFSDGYYYEGFREVLNETSRITDDRSSKVASSAVSSAQRPAVNFGSGQTLIISILIGAAVSGIIILIMRRSMNTKRMQRSAADYLIPGSYHLRTRQDIFLYSNVSKTPRQQNTSSSGSSHAGASGRSHGGGGRKF